MRWEKEIPSDESKAAACPSPSSPSLSSTSLRSPTSTQDRRPTRSMPTRPPPAAAVASAAGSSSGIGGRAIDANNASHGRPPAGASSSGKGKKGSSSEEKEEEQEREAYAEVMGPLRFEAVPLLHMVESNEAAYTYYQVGPRPSLPCSVCTTRPLYRSYGNALASTLHVRCTRMWRVGPSYALAADRVLAALKSVFFSVLVTR